jgi:hypothetical protein
VWILSIFIFQPNELFCRSSNFLLIGFVGGLGLRKWYGVLSKTFDKSAANKTLNTVKKVAGEFN